MKALKSMAFAIALIAASGLAPAYAQGAKADGKAKQIQGEVVSVNSFTGQITVKTSELPGMEGKSTIVPYVTKDAAILKKFKEGDKVVGDLVSKGNDTHLENLALAKKS